MSDIFKKMSDYIDAVRVKVSTAIDTPVEVKGNGAFYRFQSNNIVLHIPPYNYFNTTVDELADSIIERLQRDGNQRG